MNRKLRQTHISLKKKHTYTKKIIIVDNINLQLTLVLQDDMRLCNWLGRGKFHRVLRETGRYQPPWLQR